ncbi:hypothetical protein TNCV_278921 [Trichonephila clavipes]|nr:hypothetical protein TNCV_278921 [Trichonephila clavipes]
MKRYPRLKPVLKYYRKTTRREGSKDRGASTCGPHSDSFNDLSKRRRSNYSTNNFQTPCKANLKSKRTPCTLFNTRTSATASIVVPSQINVECHRFGIRLCLVMNPVCFGDR